MGYELSGFDGKVAVVTGAGRMRSIGRPMALARARGGEEAEGGGEAAGSPVSDWVWGTNPAASTHRRPAKHAVHTYRNACARLPRFYRGGALRCTAPRHHTAYSRVVGTTSTQFSSRETARGRWRASAASAAC